MRLSVVRPHCLQHPEDGVLPQPWMGRRIHPIKQRGGVDVDHEWQIPLVDIGFAPTAWRRLGSNVWDSIAL
jgi:hypothetical protein